MHKQSSICFSVSHQYFRVCVWYQLLLAAFSFELGSQTLIAKEVSLCGARGRVVSHLLWYFLWRGVKGQTQNFCEENKWKGDYICRLLLRGPCFSSSADAEFNNFFKQLPGMMATDFCFQIILALFSGLY